MKDIVIAIEKINTRDLLDYLSVVVPAIFSFVLILQSIIFHKKDMGLHKEIHDRDEALQKEIDRREQWIQNQNNILLIYGTYYEFCETIILSGFENEVNRGNVYYAFSCLNNLNVLRMKLCKRLDLSRLLFSKNDRDLFNIIDERFQLGISIIEKYMNYCTSGRLQEVSQHAWENIGIGNSIFVGDYSSLPKDKNDDLIKLCRGEEIVEIETMIDRYREMHKYEEFDVFFEKYIALV